MFSVHITPEKLKTATITSHFGFVFEENSVTENHMNVVIPLFRKAAKCVQCIQMKTKTRSFHSPVSRAFLKAPFLRTRRISFDGSLNPRNKSALSNSSGIAWTLSLYRMFSGKSVEGPK